MISHILAQNLNSNPCFKYYLNIKIQIEIIMILKYDYLCRYLGIQRQIYDSEYKLNINKNLNPII